jgi:general secretion pathway protein F
MNGPSAPAPRPAALEDIAALNREIAALVRAGFPLEEGLRQIAREDAGPWSAIADRLAQATANGKSLAEAIAEQGDALPPAYRAVVEAGLRAGRLPIALEGYADAAARIAELRRLTAQAAIYPLMVFVLACVLLFGFAARLLPSYRWLGIDARIWAMPLAMSGRTARVLSAAVVVAAVGIAIAWWRRSGTSRPASRGSWLRWIPGARRAALLSGQACFAEMLGVLASQRVALPEALGLAAQASGLPAVQHAVDELAASLAAGQPLAAHVRAARQLPPLVRTALATSASHEGLVAALLRAAATYRERATAWVGNLTVLVPVAATLGVGAFVVGVYAILLLQPYIATLQDMTQW